MKQMLQIYCKNNNISKEFPIGSSLLDIYYGFNLNFPYQVVSAKVNNRSEGLNFRVYNNKDVEFLDVRDSSGMRTYVRSLCFVLYKAVSELFPNGKLFVEHPVSKGYFCNLRIGRPVTLEDVSQIKKRMQEIIAEDITYHRIECHTTEAVRVFSERGMNDKVKLLESSGSIYTYYYTLVVLPTIITVICSQVQDLSTYSTSLNTTTDCCCVFLTKKTHLYWKMW